MVLVGPWSSSEAVLGVTAAEVERRVAGDVDMEEGMIKEAVDTVGSNLEEEGGEPVQEGRGRGGRTRVAGAGAAEVGEDLGEDQATASARRLRLCRLALGEEEVVAAAGGGGATIDR